MWTMGDMRYGFVDMGDQVLNVPQKNDVSSSSCVEINSKVEKIIENAPEELDTFVEVADKFKEIDKQINEAGLNIQPIEESDIENLFK